MNYSDVLINMATMVDMNNPILLHALISMVVFCCIVLCKRHLVGEILSTVVSPLGVMALIFILGTMITALAIWLVLSMALSLFYMPVAHLTISVFIIGIVLITGKTVYTISRVEKMKAVLEKENK